MTYTYTTPSTFEDIAIHIENGGIVEIKGQNGWVQAANQNASSYHDAHGYGDQLLPHLWRLKSRLPPLDEEEVGLIVNELRIIHDSL